MRSICGDLAAEHGDLDDLVGALSRAEWLIETSSPGWAIRDQLSHLWFFDQRASLALTDPVAFASDMQWVLTNGGTDASIAPGRSIEPEVLLGRWREDRQQLIDAASAVDPAARVPWYGPAMAARLSVVGPGRRVDGDRPDVCRRSRNWSPARSVRAHRVINHRSVISLKTSAAAYPNGSPRPRSRALMRPRNSAS